MRDNAMKNKSFYTKIQRCFSTHRYFNKGKNIFLIRLHSTHVTCNNISKACTKSNVSSHLLQDESTGEFGRPREECAHKVGHTMHVDIQEFKEVREGL